MQKSLLKYPFPQIQARVEKYRLPKIDRLLFSKGYNHGILRGNFEAMKSLHGHGWLHLIFKIYKCDTWLCFDQAHFLKTWVLFEEHFKHPTSSFMRQILYEQNIVRSSCFLGTRSLTEWSLQMIYFSPVISEKITSAWNSTLPPIISKDQ